MVLIDIVETTSPTLASGAIAVTFNKLEKVTYAQAFIDASLSSTVDASMSYDIALSTSGNVVTATIYAASYVASAVHKALATTANVAGKKLTIVAYKI